MRVLGSQEKLSLKFKTRSHINQAVQPQKMATHEITDLESRGIVLSM